MQTRPSKLGMGGVALGILRSEGARALWAGIAPSTVRLAGGIALYFVFLGEVEAVSRRLLSGAGLLSTAYGAAVCDFVTGAVSRGLAATVFCPITVLKTRQEEGVSAGGGLLTQLRHLGQTEGMAGLFAGLAPSLVRDVPYSGLSLALLRILREAIRASFGPALPASLVGVVAGAASAALATLLTQPADVVRTELVLQGLKEAQRSSLRVAAAIVRARGLSALFVGTTARLTRRMLQQGFTWAVYEVVVLAGSSAAI